MSKSTKVAVADVNATIAAGNEPINTDELAHEAAMKAEQVADSIAASIDPAERASETQALTPELVEDRTVVVAQAINHLFFDPELRQVGSNGFFYRLDYDGWDNRDDGAHATGETATVDRLSFLNASLVRGMCKVLDDQLNAPARGRFTGGLKARGDALRSRIQNTIAAAYSRGADYSDTLADLERKLANNIEQAALVSIAFGKMCECFNSITGKVYETADSRDANKAAAVKGMDPATKARLEKLGVNVG